jgi:hypothetical protein
VSKIDNWIFYILMGIGLTLTFIAIAGIAYAADYSAVLVDLRGDPIPDETVRGVRGEDGKWSGPRLCTMQEYKIVPSNCDVLTLGTAAANALLMNDPDNANLDEKEKRRRGLLADRLYHGGKIDLGLEELVLVKRLITKLYGNLVVMRALPLLDPTIEKEK